MKITLTEKTYPLKEEFVFDSVQKQKSAIIRNVLNALEDLEIKHGFEISDRRFEKIRKKLYRDLDLLDEIIRSQDG